MQLRRIAYAEGTGDFNAERAEPLKLAPRTVVTMEAPLDERRVLAKHVSVPVAQDIMVTNKVSQNLHAELAAAAAGQGVRARTAAWHRARAWCGSSW